MSHRRFTLDGVDIFYRQAGAVDAPVLLLPHGYPCSSYQYRALMPALADRWCTVAPDSLQWFPKDHHHLREHRPPTLILWGPQDGYMPEAAARAYLRDAPDAELNLFEGGGHWLLETHLTGAVSLLRDFLARHLAQPSHATGGPGR